MNRRVTTVVLVASLALAGCGGGDDPAEGTSAPADTARVTTAAAPDTTAPDTTAADSTTPATTGGASNGGVDTTAVSTAPSDAFEGPALEGPSFEGPSFVDVVDDALAPYAALIGRPAGAEVLGSALAAVLPDTPVPTGLTLAGAGRDLEVWAPGDVVDEQKASFEELLGLAELEAFGAAPPAGWRQASVSTSGSLATLLLVPEADLRRVVYTSDSESAPGGRPPLEMSVDPGDTTEIPQPAWLASLPALAGGELVELQEGIGTVTFLGTPAANGYVSVRWRYPAESLDALTAFLESGVVQSAGFTYDEDLFNGFESLVEVTAGDWVGSVIIGEASMGDQVFHDLLWTLTRP